MQCIHHRALGPISGLLSSPAQGIKLQWVYGLRSMYVCTKKCIASLYRNLLPTSVSSHLVYDIGIAGSRNWLSRNPDISQTERIAEVNDGKRHIWILVTDIDATGKLKGPEVMGVVMLSTPYSETGAFRGYVEKLLIHKNCRGKGGARALMEALETEASSLGRKMLLLDTETGSSAEAVYKKLGYVEVGRVPAYGMSPTGELKDGTFLYKQLR